MREASSVGVFFTRTFDNFIVDIGVISDEFDVVADLSQEATEDIEDDECACVTDMWQIVDG